MQATSKSYFMKKYYIQGSGITFLMLCLLLAPSCKKSGENPQAQNVHGIIPLPLNISLSEGNFVVDKNTVLVSNSLFQPAVQVVENALASALDFNIQMNQAPVGKTNIRFTEDNSMEPDAYQVEISAQGIHVKAKNPEGAFYAAQSIRQMIWNSTQGVKAPHVTLRHMTISDKPGFAWRGFHLDVSRHFFTKAYILKLIDWLAYYKFNKLQLHLTDDQGWRVQTDQFPLLTRVGAWRTFNNWDSACMNLAKTDPAYTIDPRFINDVNGQQVYGGFYTKQDIREIIAYASAHYIDVVPEIDMPGHMSAAIRAYPQLSCSDSAGWGKEFSFPICPCKPYTMDFAFKVWDEMAELFPSEFVHIGCDEVEKDTWKQSAVCQQFMKDNSLADPNEIQNYFVNKLQEHLKTKGKKVIAWDDAIDGKVDPEMLMMYWRDWVTDSPARCAGNGNSIILTPWSHFYLSSPSNDENLQKLYFYLPGSIYPVFVNQKVIGMQGCVWTEEIPSEAVFEKHVFPAIAALSEVCWTNNRDWPSFQLRMKTHLTYLHAQNIHYRKPAWAD